MSEIAAAVSRVVKHLEAHPEDGYDGGVLVTATTTGLRASSESPDGHVVVTDMPRGIGGGASAPSPGWLLRAALASCDATLIAMRAASIGVELDTLEVTVAMDFDDRGLLGTDDTVPAGPLSSNVSVRIGAEKANEETLREIVDWAEHHSPVGDALSRAIPGTLSVDVVD
ncbi:MAG: OsmC family protein [Acidimicrobiia bacterium]